MRGLHLENRKIGLTGDMGGSTRQVSAINRLQLSKAVMPPNEPRLIFRLSSPKGFELSMQHQASRMETAKLILGKLMDRTGPNTKSGDGIFPPLKSLPEIGKASANALIGPRTMAGLNCSNFQFLDVFSWEDAVRVETVTKDVFTYSKFPKDV